jgi:uncharacterized membrane protein (DUF4010 family)
MPKEPHLQATTLQETALSFGTSLAIGVLIGLERESANPDRAMGAGVRTFALLGLSGAISAWLHPAFGLYPFLATMFTTITFFALRMHSKSMSIAGNSGGFTTELAALLTLLLGSLPFADGTGLALTSRILLALALGAAVTGVLALRQTLHNFAKSVAKQDVIATVQFILLAALALPLMPDRGFGPYQAINPFQLMLMLVLVGGISFVGYVAVRMLGTNRGHLVAALFGGLVSSTAVTLSETGRFRESPAQAWNGAAAILLASSIMFPRVWLELQVVDGELAAAAGPILGAMGLVGILAFLMAYRRQRDPHSRQDDQINLTNPFRLDQAFRTALAFALITLLSATARDLAGDSGIFLSALAAGLTDVDAVALSMAGLVRNGALPQDTATSAVILAVISNTMTKATIARVMGGKALGNPVMIGLGAAALAGGIGAFLEAR